MLKSQPTRAAWIEIFLQWGLIPESHTSQPTRAAWIEITMGIFAFNKFWSQPTRAAWIEIFKILGTQKSQFTVAAHSGCVD